MKKIITHVNPDLDAVCSVWLLKRFLPGWQEAEVDFTQSTDKKVEGENENLVYVDVGLGKLDHHQINKHISASKLCWDYIQEIRAGEKLGLLEENAIARLVNIVTQVDNNDDSLWPEAKNDRYQFYLQNLIDSWRELPLNDMEVIEEGFKMLDSTLISLKNKIRAEEELKKATIFKTKWGEGVGVETGNKYFLYFARIVGYQISLTKNPKNGGVRIHARPGSKVDLTKTYNEVKKLDPQSDWFLHSSKKLLLNQASVTKMRPTKLSLKQMIEVLQK